MTPASPSSQRLWALQVKYAPYVFIAPFVILFCSFMLYPLGRSVYLSLHKSAGPEMDFVGLGNFRFILTDRIFWLAVANTVGYTLVYLALQIPASLGLALLLNSKALRLRSFFRFAFFAPVLVGHVFVAVIFSLLLAQRHGLVNQGIGTVLPFIGTETNWLGDPNYVMPAVVIASLWLSLGYGMVYFLAALQGVDRELYEAAEVDGAGPWAKFWHVTIPGIKPVLIFLTLVGTIGALQLFELPYVLFQGPGPNQRGLTIVMYLFQYGFEFGDIAFASAVGWVLVCLISVVSFVQLRVTRATKEA
jgi:ABC-type sugar transport system permease subunit